MRNGIAVCISIAWIAAFATAAGAVAPELPKRVVSINACTDQLLWALANRDQITALTNFAVDPTLSLHPDEIKASGVRLIRGGAEEVLKLEPDLVLAGSFTRAITRERLTAFGLRLETYDPAESIEAAKADILRTAQLLGHEARGVALVAEIDAALTEARAAVRSRGLRVLQLSRNAYTSGAETLFDDVLDKLGVVNAGRDLGMAGPQRAGLEAALKLRPHALVMFDTIGRPADQGAALLLHPALEASFPPERRIVVPGNLIACGGPSLPALLRSLANGLIRTP